MIVTVPVNVYTGVSRVMVTAPLPGLEPQNILLRLDGHRFSIAASLRGPGQDRTRRFVLQEWRVGSFERTVELPAPVDASRANATFDNGVLVVMLPIAPQPVSGTITMPKVGTAKGLLIQHVGMGVLPR
jgi:HSP20 family protein